MEISQITDTVVTEVVVPGAKWTLKRIWRHLSYVFHYKRNIKHLTGQVQELRDKRDGVNLEVRPATEASKIIDPGVDRWLGDVEEIIKETDTSFSEETVAAKAACCYGWLPDLKCRHSLGREAKKRTLEVDNLLAKDLGTIAHPARPAQVEFQATEDSTQLGTNFHEGASSSGTSNHEQPPASEGKNINFNSRRSTIEDVMEALRGNQINPIVLCGLGGMGKTTLMGQVFEKAKEEGLFNEYTKATVKESIDKAPDVIQIQGELAEYLGKILEDEKEAGPRASKLRLRLSQGSKKILVMLDNVSGTTTRDFLWEIGIPPNCKLLVTSRQQDLFKDMDTRKNFPIHALPNTDAWSLFKKTAGSSIESDPELQVVAEKVLKECAGLPIAISTVGTALKGESIAIWKNALRELEQACPENVPGVIEHVYGKIKFSYECLRSKQAKSCFLLCCIFGKTADIPIEDLFKYALGLGQFEGVGSMVERRNSLETLVQTLKSRFLLLVNDDEPDRVRMHDVVHDVAIHMASGKTIMVPHTMEILELMNWPISEQSVVCRSLIIGGRCELLQLIRMSKYALEAPPTIFNKMEDLKVLVIMNMSLLPSLGSLENLQTLCLEWCDLECDVSVIGELRRLVILSFHGSDIKQLPETYKNLSNLRLLDLSGCTYLEIIPPGVISSLSRLEELYMWDSFENWVGEKLASIETTNWISQLEVKEGAGSKEVYEWERLKRSAVEQPANVGRQFREEVHDVYRANDEHTRWANSMDWNSGLLAELLSLSRLTTLEVVLPPVNKLLTSSLFNKLERFKISIGWEKHIRDWELKHDGNYLRIHDLDASAVVGSRITLLLKKTSIFEFRTKNLTEPQLHNVLDTEFLKTKSLKVEKCDAVKYLIDTTRVKPTAPHSSSVVFPVLNSLEISGARRLKEIFHGELTTGSLKELRSLALSKLPALTYIWKTKSQSEWVLLRNILGLVEVLIIEDCSSLEKIVAFEDDEEVINFQSLTKLTLSGLPSFTEKSNNMLGRPLQNISRGQSDTIILPLFDNKVHFPVLGTLYIEGMDNITEIWNGQLSTGSFCKLISLAVRNCNKLLHVVPAHMQNRLQELELIEVEKCPSLKEIFEFRRLSVNEEYCALTISQSGKTPSHISQPDQGTQIIKKIMDFKQSHQAFQNVTRISIGICHSLKTVMSPSIARGLVKLQTLHIEDCRKIKEIVAAAEDEETEDDNMFPQLCTLHLDGLPNLGSFSQGKYNFKWPLLRAITILRCYNMKKFCLGSVSAHEKVEIRFNGADECVRQELNNSRNRI